MTEPTCETCRFWKRFPIDPDEGFCRRYPPMPFLRIDDHTSVEILFPEVFHFNWCGEHQPRPEPVQGAEKPAG